jgi:hypothetical protein
VEPRPPDVLQVLQEDECAALPAVVARHVARALFCLPVVCYAIEHGGRACCLGVVLAVSF